MQTEEFLAKFSTKRDAVAAATIIVSILKEDGFILTDGLVEKWENILEECEGYIGKKTKKELEKEQLAIKVMDTFNQITGSSFRNLIKIRSVISQVPNVTFEQFESVIVHKEETWGKDPKMKQYLRPATLFGSKTKFLNYLDDATNYWIGKAKQEGARQLTAR